MTNTSILAAFERLWQHIMNLFATKQEVNNVVSKKAQVQIITWEDDD